MKNTLILSTFLCISTSLMADYKDDLDKGPEEFETFVNTKDCNDLKSMLNDGYNISLHKMTDNQGKNIDYLSTFIKENCK